MQYRKTIILKDGRECCIRSCTKDDAAEIIRVFTDTHRQTDFMLTYADESTMTPETEGEFLDRKAENPVEAELLAQVDGVTVGSAGIDAVGSKYKIRHRAEFGIGIDKAYWGLGIGRALTEACIECAKSAGYEQLELNAVSDNERAIKLYESLGFTEYGRNPKGFKSRFTGYQELIYMRLEL